MPCFSLKYNEIYLTVDALYLFASLSVYPLYYWYIKLLTVETEFRVSNLIQFLPAILLSIFHEFFHIVASPAEQMQYLREVLVAGNMNLVLSAGNVGWLARIYVISRILFSVQVIYCLILGYRLVNRHNERINDFYSNLEDKRLAWVSFMNILIVLCSLSSTIFNFLGRGRFLDNESSLVIPSAIFSSLLFTIGLLAVKQNTTIHEMESEPESGNQTAIQSDKSHAMLKHRLNELMVTERMYLVPDLRITTLCKLLNTNRTYLSNLINEETGDNFNAYINRFRIEHAMHLMNQKGGNMLVMDFIAQESGFGSSSSFIRAFKTVKGITPGKYLNDKQIVLIFKTIQELRCCEITSYSSSIEKGFVSTAVHPASKTISLS